MRAPSLATTIVDPSWASASLPRATCSWATTTGAATGGGGAGGGGSFLREHPVEITRESADAPSAIHGLRRIRLETYDEPRSLAGCASSGPVPPVTPHGAREAALAEGVPLRRAVVEERVARASSDRTLSCRDRRLDRAQDLRMWRQPRRRGRRSRARFRERHDACSYALGSLGTCFVVRLPAQKLAVL